MSEINFNPDRYRSLEVPPQAILGQGDRPEGEPERGVELRPPDSATELTAPDGRGRHPREPDLPHRELAPIVPKPRPEPLPAPAASTAPTPSRNPAAEETEEAPPPASSADTERTTTADRGRAQGQSVEALMADIVPPPLVGEAVRPRSAFPEPKIVTEGDRKLATSRNQDSKKAVIEEAGRQLLAGEVPGWPAVEVSDPHPHKSYHKNDENAPTLFAKTSTVMADSADTHFAEMEIAPQVTDVVEGEKAQQIVQTRGFKDITFVEPLAALVEPYGESTSFMKRTLIYPWQDGHPLGSLEPGDPAGSALEQNKQALDAMKTDLTTLFMQNGIAPRDMHIRQFLVRYDQAGGAHLALIDTEQFRRREQEVHDATPVHPDAGEFLAHVDPLYAEINALSRDTWPKTPSLNQREIRQQSGELLEQAAPPRSVA